MPSKPFLLAYRVSLVALNTVGVVVNSASFQAGPAGYVDADLSILLRIPGFLCRCFGLPTPEDPELGIFVFVRNISNLCCSLRHRFPVSGSRRGWHGSVRDRDNPLCAGHVRRR